MANPVVNSVTFDKASYIPGDTISATVDYSTSNTSPTSSSYTLTATVTDSVTTESGSGTGVFTVQGAATLNPAHVSVSGGQPGQVWTVASDDYKSRAVLTAVALDPANPNPIPPPNQTVFKTSENLVGQTWGGFIFYNNGWNTAEVGPETIWLATATAPFTWGVVSQQSTATPHVKAYPCVQLNCDIPAGTITSATSSWLEGGPAYTGGLYDGPQNGIDYQTTWDIWTTGNAREIMIWTRNAGQTPAGSLTGTVTIAGLVYDVWLAASTISYVAQARFATAVGYDVSLFIKDSVERGFISAADNIIQFCFGWEICQTNNEAKNFSCSNFTLDLQHS